MNIVKCPKCGYSTFQPDGNGEVICPSCKTKISYTDPILGNPIMVILGILGFLFMCAAMAGAFN